jgi:hypothetical protein
VLIALVISLALRAQAEPLARKPWHTSVAVPRPGLPAVAVDLGYPGPYVPAINSPVALSAVAADVPFDGFIGFHFAVGGRKTIDTPVVARAILRPRQSWSFATIATMRKWGASPDNGAKPRNLVIEWRDRDMNLITIQEAGVPPWTKFTDDLLPLRIADDGGATAFGGAAYAQAPDGLSDRAQWYAGFASVVCRLDTWSGLPRRVREAIFASGVYIVLTGPPEPEQRLDDLDKAILPIVFNARPGSYAAPWPYRGSRPMPVPAPLSWVAKPGAGFAGAAQNPYIVRTDASAWTADDAALLRPLPSTTHIASRQRPANASWLNPIELFEGQSKTGFVSAHRAKILTGGMLVLSIASWFMARRRLLTAVVAAVIAVAFIIVGVRERLRPSAGASEDVARTTVAPGIVETFRARMIYGPSPIVEPADRSDRARTSLTGDFGFPELAEVRASDTPPSMGMMVRGSDWDSFARWTYRREIDPAAVASNRVIAVVLRDLHGSMAFWSIQRPTGSAFQMEGNLTKQTDGRAFCSFALDSAATGPGREATLHVGNVQAGSDFEVAWGGGSIKVTPAAASPSWVIPAAVLQQIAEQGGIVSVTITKPAMTPAFRTWIEVKEKKS